MTIHCTWCAKRIREVCPHCGCPAAEFFFSWRLFLHGFRGSMRLLALRVAYSDLTKDLFTCSSICKQVLFLRGLGGMGHGVCEECKKQKRFVQVGRERGVV
jgi:hypothetical protein